MRTLARCVPNAAESKEICESTDIAATRNKRQKRMNILSCNAKAHAIRCHVTLTLLLGHETAINASFYDVIQMSMKQWHPQVSQSYSRTLRRRLLCVAIRESAASTSASSPSLSWEAEIGTSWVACETARS